MRYLLVNHIAATPGRDGAHVSFPAAWAAELSAAGRVAASMNVQLRVASPAETRPHRSSIRAELLPDASGFEHVPLPGYRSARGFLRCRASLNDALARICLTADVIQLDAGGYPMPLGVVASEHVNAMGKRCIWTIAGDPPASTLGGTASTVAKRAVGRRVDARVGHELYDAIRACSHVVATTEHTVGRLRDEHDVTARWIDVLDLFDHDLPDSRAVAARHAALVDTSRPLRLVAVGPHNVSRGTASILHAMSRAWRLRVPVELTIAGEGEELDSLRQLAATLDLAPVVRFDADTNRAMRASDVLVDASTDPAASGAVITPLSMGLAPIAMMPSRRDAPVHAVERGDVEALTSAIFDAAARRAGIAARMLAGIEWCRARTVEASYRRRFELVLPARRSGKRRVAA